jgi:prolipoprotein diacylglyceryltransferase
VLLAALAAAAALTVLQGLVLPLPGGLSMSISFLCGVFVSGAFFMLYPPAVRFYPTDVRATGVGAAVAFGRIGNTVSPTVAGLMLGAGFAPQAVFWVMAVPLVMSCAALLLFHRLTVPRGGTAVG